MAAARRMTSAAAAWCSASNCSKTAKPKPRPPTPPKPSSTARLQRGLGFKVTMGNVLTLTPPLVISEDDLMRGLDILEGCIGEVGSGAHS